MINHAADAEWIGLPKSTEKEGLLYFSFLWTNFLHLLLKLRIKSLNLDHYIRIHFMYVSAAALKDANIVKLSRIGLCSYCFFKTCVIEWRMSLFFF